MGLFNLSIKRRSASTIFGHLKHANNNDSQMLKSGSENRYKQIYDAQYATQSVKERLEVNPKVKKYILTK